MLDKGVDRQELLDEDRGAHHAFRGRPGCALARARNDLAQPDRSARLRAGSVERPPVFVAHR